MNWELLACRHGDGDPVVGLYHAPRGCHCFSDPVQALCAQHGLKGTQNVENMSLMLARPGCEDFAPR